MALRIPIYIFLVAAALLFSGCARISEADKTAALETVRSHLAALKAKDGDAVTATVHPNSPHFEQSKSTFGDYELTSAEVESAKGDAIRVRFVRETKKLTEIFEMKHLRETGVYVLQRDGAKWKLWSTEGLETVEVGAPGK